MNVNRILQVFERSGSPGFYALAFIFLSSFIVGTVYSAGAVFSPEKFESDPAEYRMVTGEISHLDREKRSRGRHGKIFSQDIIQLDATSTVYYYNHDVAVPGPFASLGDRVVFIYHDRGTSKYGNQVRRVFGFTRNGERIVDAQQAYEGRLAITRSSGVAGLLLILFLLIPFFYWFSPLFGSRPLEEVPSALQKELSKPRPIVRSAD